jgi:hypothetical protein
MQRYAVFGLTVIGLMMASTAGARGGGSHGSSSGSHYVAPHTTKNGTYVEGHYQSNPNSTKADNYSTKGNVNPYTGESGKVKPASITNSVPAGSGSIATPLPLRSTTATTEKLSTPSRSSAALYRTAPRTAADVRRRDAFERRERSSAMRSAFQHRSPCPSTGYATGACPGYVIDHVVPLCANGADLPSNMQWQTVADAKRKDGVERKSCARR